MTVPDAIRAHLLTPLAAFACKALSLLFSSAAERLGNHAEAKIEAGTHFLVGSGRIDRFLSGLGGDRTVGLGEEDLGTLATHRSVLISLKKFPVDPDDGLDGCGSAVGLEGLKGLELERRALEAESLAEAAARFNAAIPAGGVGV